jgi:N-acetylglutamate synthase-like GNAT family acetyltransferase
MLKWIPEPNPLWDAEKARVVGGAPPGAIDVGVREPGRPLPGDWWRVESAGRAVGYGWMDTTWNGAEIVLAVDATAQRGGVGTFILDRLEDEAASRNLNYLFNVVRPTHPKAREVTSWLERRGFLPSGDGDLRRQVRRP